MADTSAARAVQVFLIVIWLVAGAGFFWPIFPLIGFVIAVAAPGWRLYGQKPITEADVEREIQRGGDA
jgi:hypothetical protein